MGLAELLRSTVDKRLDEIKAIRDAATESVSETTGKSVETISTILDKGIDTLSHGVDTGKKAWELPRGKTWELIEDAVRATQKAREEAELLAIERAEEAAKAAELAAKQSKGLVEGVVDFIGGFVNDAGKFLSDGVKGLVGGAIDAVNWITDMIMHPDRFITWLSNVVAGLW